MELNWTTVVLEIINFLVLVWILKRFLYRPVLQVIEQRRQRIDATLLEAQRRQEQAEQLRTEYAGRLAAWQKEKEAQRELLQRELQQQRAQALQELESTLTQTRDKARVLERKRLHELTEQAEQHGVQLGSRFASRLLERLAGPELESRIIALLQEELNDLPATQLELLRHATRDTAAHVQVETAYEPTQDQRMTVESAVHALFGPDLHCDFRQNPSLIAGLRLSLGAWSVGLNLGDELKGFTETAHDSD